MAWAPEPLATLLRSTGLTEMPEVKSQCSHLLSVWLWAALLPLEISVSPSVK